MADPIPAVGFATQGDHVAAFIETFCRHTKGRWALEADPRIVLEDWQRAFLREAYRLGPDGRRVYHTAVLGIPRKNGKSTIAAGVGLYHLAADGEAGPEVILAAGSRDQASIVFDQARDFVDADPTLPDFLDAQRLIIRNREGGFCRRISADGRLQHGLNPSFIGVDELHSFTTPRQEELWAALTTATGARLEPFTLIITTAGTEDSVTLNQLVDAALLDASKVERRQGLTIVRDVEAGFLLWWYGVPGDVPVNLDDEADWLPHAMAANPASWITADVLRRLRYSPTVSEGDFRRLHLNQRTSAKESWLPSGAWEALSAADFRIPDGAPVWLGVDVGITNDTTGVATAWHSPELARVGLEARTWAARGDVVAHVHVDGGRFNIETAEDYILSQAARYQVRGVVYDPRYFERSAGILSGKGLSVIALDQSSAAMPRALQAFYNAVSERRIVHGGDPILTAHVTNAAGSMTERGWKVSKLPSYKGRRKIDGLIAAVMAHAYAERVEPDSVYAHRGLRVL